MLLYLLFKEKFPYTLFSEKKPDNISMNLCTFFEKMKKTI